jgi:hypothetical protein
MPGIYEQPGSDLTLNTSGYVTAIASTNTISSNSDTSLDIANQGLNPNWVQNDYALLINTTAIPVSVARLTANVTGAQQRTFTFTGNASAFTAGDIVAIWKVEPETSGITVGTGITSTATTSLVISGANTISNGSFLQVETNTAGIYELMAVTSGGGSGTLIVVRQRANTNPTGVNIDSAKEVKVLANIEIANVQAITSATTMSVNRGWYNTTPLDFLTTGTTIQKILSGDITQTDSPIITAFTLSNNIARRSMEFITTEPRPVENDEQDDEDAYGDDEFNNAEHVYVNPHFNDDDEDYENYDHHHYMQDEDYAYEHEDI